jgi:hypothetical protein
LLAHVGEELFDADVVRRLEERLDDELPLIGGAQAAPVHVLGEQLAEVIEVGGGGRATSSGFVRCLRHHEFPPLHRTDRIGEHVAPAPQAVKS